MVPGTTVWDYHNYGNDVRNGTTTGDKVTPYLSVVGDRQFHDKGGSFAPLALGVDPAAMIGYYPVRNTMPGWWQYERFRVHYWHPTPVYLNSDSLSISLPWNHNLPSDKLLTGYSLLVIINCNRLRLHLLELKNKQGKHLYLQPYTWWRGQSSSQRPSDWSPVSLSIQIISNEVMSCIHGKGSLLLDMTLSSDD